MSAKTATKVNGKGMRRSVLSALTSTLAFLMASTSTLAFLMASSVLIASSFSDAGEITAHIMLNSRAEVHHEAIVLGQVAAIEALDPQMAARLASVEIGHSLAPGQVRRIDADQIRMRLRQSGIDPAPMRIDGADAIEVARFSHVVSGSEIEKTVMDYLNAHISDPAAQVRIVQPCTDVVLPRGELRMRVEAPRQTSLVGPVQLAVVFDVDGQPVKKNWVTAEVAIFAEVVVARRALARFEIISTQDVELRSLNLANLPPGVIVDSAEVVGRRAKKPIVADRPVRSDMVELVPVVKKGDVVQMVAERAGMRVTALGEVRQNGAKGERIQVMNVDSRKILFAKVMDSRTVVIGR